MPIKTYTIQSGEDDKWCEFSGDDDKWWEIGPCHPDEEGLRCTGGGYGAPSMRFQKIYLKWLLDVLYKSTINSAYFRLYQPEPHHGYHYISPGEILWWVSSAGWKISPELKSHVQSLVDSRSYEQGECYFSVSIRSKDYDDQLTLWAYAFEHGEYIPELIIDYTEPIEKIVDGYKTEIDSGKYLLKAIKTEQAANTPWGIDSEIGFVGWRPDPYDGQKDVPIDKRILFHLKDKHSGIDIDTVWVKINNVKFQKGDPEFKYAGEKNDYTISIRPNENWKHGKEVNVEVYGEDLFGNPGLDVEIL